MRTDELEQRLGERLRALRIQRDLTQAELAEAANVSLGALKRLERGMRVHDDHARQRAARPRPGALARCTGAGALPLQPTRRSRGPQQARGKVFGCSQGAPSKVEHLMTYQPTDVIEVLAWGRPRRRRRPRSRHRLVRLRLRARVGRPGLRSRPAAHAAAQRALRVSRPPAGHLLPAAAVVGRRAARRVRQRAGQRVARGAGHPRRTHHAARPPRLRRRPGHGGARVPPARPNHRNRRADRGAAGRPGLGGSSHREG